MNTGTSIALAALLAAFTTGCASTKPSTPSVKTKTASAPLHPVPKLDLPRFMGDWRVIANIPYFAEKDCVDSIESYALRPDGKIDNWFRFRKKSFEAPQQKMTALAWVHDRESQAEWRVRFFGLITVKYFVLEVDPAYQWTVIGHPSRKYGWIMARGKTLPDETYEKILARLPKHGYDPAQFKRVPQLPSQMAWLH